MNNQHSRRNFLKSAAALPFAATAAAGLATPLSAAAEQQPIARTGGPQLKVSLNAYSFARLLNDQIKGRGKGVSLFDVLEFCAKNDFDGFDPTGYYFPTYPEVPPDDYVNSLKRRAFELGVGISGTGVRNNFTTSDKTVRAAAVQHIKEWVEVASRLGASVIRVFADTQMRAMTWRDVAKGYTRDQVKARRCRCRRRCEVTIPRGDARVVRIMLPMRPSSPRPATRLSYSLRCTKTACRSR